MRLEALKRIENDLAECMPNLEFETYVICSEKDIKTVYSLDKIREANLFLKGIWNTITFFSKRFV